MIRILRVRRRIAGLGRNVFSNCTITKENFKTVEAARKYYQRMYVEPILLDYETIE
nr:MAG TPA: hypothetical protein [Caudoviricetes sp.]